MYIKQHLFSLNLSCCCFAQHVIYCVCASVYPLLSNLFSDFPLKICHLLILPCIFSQETLPGAFLYANIMTTSRVTTVAELEGWKGLGLCSQMAVQTLLKTSMLGYHGARREAISLLNSSHCQPNPPCFRLSPSIKLLPVGSCPDFRHYGILSSRDSSFSLGRFASAISFLDYI